MENRTYFAEFELLVQFSLFAKDYIDEGPLVIITIAFGIPSKSFLISCFHQISSFELTPVNYFLLYIQSFALNKFFRKCIKYFTFIDHFDRFIDRLLIILLCPKPPSISLSAILPCS